MVTVSSSTFTTVVSRDRMWTVSGAATGWVYRRESAGDAFQVPSDGLPATMLPVPPATSCGVVTTTGAEAEIHFGALTVSVAVPRVVPVTVKYRLAVFTEIVSGFGLDVAMPGVIPTLNTSGWSIE